MSGGYGFGWGLTPWGGFLLPLAPNPDEDGGPPDCNDIFCFFDDPTSMAEILTDLRVSTIDGGGQFFENLTTNDLEIYSGGGVITSANAVLQVAVTVPQTWTMQAIAMFPSLPSDFTDVVHSHVYVGASDAAGPSAGVFLSSAGVAYSATINHSGGNLVLNGPFQVIPGTAGLIQEGISYTIRIAAAASTSSVYIFITETSILGITGHQLIGIVPAIQPGDLSSSATDRAVISVRGTASHGSTVLLDQLCMCNGLAIPNLPPRADAGRDQAIRMCTVGTLDGTASFDPEGVTLAYSWRVVDAPISSVFSFEGADGFTIPELTPTGFTSKFYSAELGSESITDPISVGDVLVVGGGYYSITTTGVDGTGFYAQITAQLLPDNLVNVSYKLLRQRALSGATTAHPTFFPDQPGIFRFDLVVSDGQYVSEPSVVIVNVLESQVPKGCTPDLSFLWQYLSDFWRLVEDRERIQVLWESMAQVTAAELLTLWQVDYSKSLRDVPRAFQRRWLHYDLKLAEPLPELSTVRPIFNGVYSSSIVLAGVSGISGTTLQVVSVVHPTKSIVFTLPNPYTATALASILRVKLQGIDSRYEVAVVMMPGGTAQQVRIYAPFPFTIGAGTTVPVFTATTRNTYPSGTDGLRITSRTYKVDGTLEGLGIVEGDVIVIEGEGYRISRLLDDATDDFRFQRVVVQSDLPLLPGKNWSIPGHVTSRLLNFYNGLVSQEDHVFLEVINTSTGSTTLVDVAAAGAVSTEPGKLALYLVPSVHDALAQEGFLVYLAYVVRRRHLPIGELVTDIPCLQEMIKETADSAVLRRNVDYFIEEFRGQNSLRFASGAAGDPGDVWEGEVPPDRMWAEVTYLDNRPTIEANFGIPAELTLDQLAEIGTDVDYLSAVRGLWFTLINGPTMFNMRAGTQILLGLPFAEEAGVIEEIRPDFSPTQGRILVRDSGDSAIVRSYSYPSALDLDINPATSKEYAVGDTVRQFAPLVSGADVIDYVKDPRWFQGILNQGIFFEVEKFHKFMVRVDSAAFSLSSLLFVRSFILRVKPTYTLPLFVVREKVGDTEVSVSDELSMKGRLLLNEGACFPNFGVAQIFDDYRAAGGGIRNQYDTDGSDLTAPPTYPTPDANITWGFDKLYLCPEDAISISWCIDHAGGAVQYDQGFRFDDANQPSHHFADSTVTSIGAPPGGYVLPTTSSVSVTGTIEDVRVVITGTLGTDPGDYELFILDNSSEVASIPLTVGTTGFIGTFTVSVAVVSGHTLEVGIRPASGVSSRAPNWSTISITLKQEGIAFGFDSGLPAGTYCFTNAG